MKKVALAIAGAAIGSVLAFAIVWLSVLVILGAMAVLKWMGLL